MNLKSTTVVLIVLIAVHSYEGQAQPSRYTIDDVIARLDALEKRLEAMDTKYEVRLARLETRVDEMEKRFVESLDSTRTTLFWGFGIFTVLYSLILGIVLATYREVKPRAGLRPEVDAAVLAEVRKLLEPIEKQVAELSQRERALEERLSTETRKM